MILRLIKLRLRQKEFFKKRIAVENYQLLMPTAILPV